MSTVAIIQARTGSSRLPNKVLTDILGQSMLERVVRRLARARTLDRLVVATTVEPADAAIVDACSSLGDLELPLDTFRGSEDDVLDRYVQAARARGAERVVRITSDCPLIDPQVVDRVVEALDEPGGDYASNHLERSYPRGLDAEAMPLAVLETAWREAKEPFERVHVTPFLYRNPERFRLVPVAHETNLHHHRWTVDTEDDLALVRALYQRLEGDDHAPWQKVLALFDREPALLELNQHIRQKALEEG